MGKTTLLERLIPALVQRGLSVSLVKHSHKSVDLDRPGKDSFRLREAGCDDVVIIGKDRWGVVHELRDDPEPDLAEILAAIRPCDLLLVEGMKNGSFPKMEVWRAEPGKPALWPSDPRIMAVVTDDDGTLRSPHAPRRFDLGDVEGLADFAISTAASSPASPSQTEEARELDCQFDHQ